MSEQNYPLKYWWLVLIVVPIIVAMIGIMPNLFEKHEKEIRDSQTWILTGNVIDAHTELPIQGAKVVFEVQGIAKITNTDSEGSYKIAMTFAGQRLVGRVSVDAIGYESYNRSFEALPHQTQLDKIVLKSVIPTPTPIPAPTVTPMPTATPTPTPTVTPTPLPPSDETAVLIVDERNTIHGTLNSQITAILQKKGVNITIPPIFTDVFVSDGTFERLFQGSALDVKPFQPYFKYGIFGRKTVSFENHPELENTITAMVSLELHIVSSRSGVTEETFNIRQKGVAFSETEAETRAIESVLKEVEQKIEERVTMF